MPNSPSDTSGRSVVGVKYRQEMLLLVLPPCTTNWKKKQKQKNKYSWQWPHGQARRQSLHMPMNLIPLLFTSNDFRKVELSTVCVLIRTQWFLLCTPDGIQEPVSVSQFWQLRSWKLSSKEYFEMLGLTMEDRMGRKRVVVATLLVHSVKVAMRRQSRKAMAGAGMVSRGVSWLPNHVDRPDSCNTAKREARLEREEPHHCPVAVLQPSLLREFLCKLLSGEKHSQGSQTGLFSRLNKNLHYFPSKELEKSCIYSALLTAKNYLSVQIITCVWSIFEALFF